jgi:copper chaperone
MQTLTIHIEGMTCNHCVMHVKKELSKIPRIIIDDVQIGSAIMQFDESTTTQEDLSRAIEEAGYKVRE